MILTITPEANTRLILIKQRSYKGSGKDNTNYVTIYCIVILCDTTFLQKTSLKWLKQLCLVRLKSAPVAHLFLLLLFSIASLFSSVSSVSFIPSICNYFTLYLFLQYGSTVLANLPLMLQTSIVILYCFLTLLQ